MKATLIQTSLHWEDRQQNLAHFDSLIDSVKEETDLIILPEMFTTGFTMNPERLAEPANGETYEWLKKKASKKKCVITGSVAVEENGKYYNRLLWASPDKTIYSYDKRHLFRMAKEDQHYTSGKNKLITKVREWNICPLVCYDLRFPVWCRNKYSREKQNWDYDVLIFVANWPEVRNYPWKQLLIARAIENQCYVIGVNRIGMDGNNIVHSGDSAVINPRGEVISSIKAHEDRIETVSLDKNYLDEFRKIFPVGLDSDHFELK